MPLKVVRRKDTGTLQISGIVAGRRIRKGPASADLKLAKEEAAKLEAEILRTAWHGERRGARSFAEAVEAYLDSAPRSSSTQQRLLRLMQAIGNASLAEINQEAVLRARATLGAETASTLKRGIITPLRAVVLHAHRLGWCDAPYFEIPREPRGRTRYLLPAEAERLLAEAAPHIRLLATFLLCTGARMSEALELEWRDVDLLGRRAIFWRTKNGSRRVAALTPRAVAALAAAGDKTGAVFRTNHGRAFADRLRQGGGQIKTAWRGALDRAKLDPELTPHDLRHCWATWHYAVYKDLLLLKQEGGWSSVSLVERYAHLMPAGCTDEIQRFWGYSRHELQGRTA